MTILFVFKFCAFAHILQCISSLVGAQHEHYTWRQRENYYYKSVKQKIRSMMPGRCIKKVCIDAAPSTKSENDTKNQAELSISSSSKSKGQKMESDNNLQSSDANTGAGVGD